jgi:hypothetical protein
VSVYAVSVSEQPAAMARVSKSAPNFLPMLASDPTPSVSRGPAFESGANGGWQGVFFRVGVASPEAEPWQAQPTGHLSLQMYA